MIDSSDSLVVGMVGGVKHDIEARIRNGIADLCGRVEVRISGKTKLVSA